MVLRTRLVQTLLLAVTLSFVRPFANSSVTMSDGISVSTSEITTSTATARNIEPPVTCLTRGAEVNRPDWDSVHWTELCKGSDVFDFTLIIQGGKKFRLVGTRKGVSVSEITTETT